MVEIKRIELADFDLLLSRAKAEHWRQIAIVGPGRRSKKVEDWAVSLRGAERVFQLGSKIERDERLMSCLASTLPSLPAVTSLVLSGHSLDVEDARAIATFLPNLTSLDLSNNDIRTEGAKAIADSLHGLTSLNLTANRIGSEGARAIAASLHSLTSFDLGGNHIGAEGARAIAASLHGLTSLGLGGNVIGAEGARAIAASLHSLTSLDLVSNGIRVEGVRAIAASLHSLTSLDLRGNGIGVEGARAIAASLHGLTSLDLGDNGIGDEGARAIAASLQSLTSLGLHSNQIGDEGARAIAASLHSLTSLDLHSNQIGDEGARAIAASLHSLTSLDLGGNNIRIEGAKVVLNAWLSEQRSGRRYLALSRNALDGLLPKEVLETTDAQSILAAYRRFAFAEAKQSLRPLNELKLIVVGNEAVGKTSLLQYLIEGKPRDPDETKTSGIAQHEKIEIRGWSPDDCHVQLNVWDFGGQEMMRGTHRFFLTERSLYLLVLEDRRQDDRSVYDWMKTIRNRGGDSPVIVVINKADNGKQDLRVDENGLQHAYPSITAFLRTSCDPGEWAGASIKELRRTIVETIVGNGRLGHVHDPIPENWLQIKDRVRALASERSVLPYADFVSLCRDTNGGAEAVVDDIEQRALLRLSTISAPSSRTAWSAMRRLFAVKSPCLIPTG
jgi:small GTP-binding protein